MSENSGKLRETEKRNAFHNHYHIHNDDHLSIFQSSPSWSMSSSLKANSGSPKYDLPDEDDELRRLEKANKRTKKISDKIRRLTNGHSRKIHKKEKRNVSKTQKEDLKGKLQSYGQLKYQLKKSLYWIKKREDQIQEEIWESRDDGKGNSNKITK